MVSFLDTGFSTIFRLFNVEVALCVTTAARRAAEFSTEELVRKDRISDSDRISKIRARHLMRNEESYNHISGCNSLMSTVRPASVPHRKVGHDTRLGPVFSKSRDRAEINTRARR